MDQFLPFKNRKKRQNFCAGQLSNGKWIFIDKNGDEYENTKDLSDDILLKDKELKEQPQEVSDKIKKINDKIQSINNNPQKLEDKETWITRDDDSYEVREWDQLLGGTYYK